MMSDLSLSDLIVFFGQGCKQGKNQKQVTIQHDDDDDDDDGRNPVNSPVEEKVVYIPLFIRLFTFQVVVWDF